MMRGVLNDVDNLPDMSRIIAHTNHCENERTVYAAPPAVEFVMAAHDVRLRASVHVHVGHTVSQASLNEHPRHVNATFQRRSRDAMVMNVL